VMHVKIRAASAALASCLAAALLSASAASAAVITAFDPVPSETARNTPVTVTLRMTNPDQTDVANVALAINASRFNDDDETSAPIAPQGVNCGNGTQVTSLPVGTPPGTVACHWDTVAKNGGVVAMSVTILPPDGSYVSLRGYQAIGAAIPVQAASANTQVARPKADLNIQVSAPGQIAVGETAQLKTTLNMVSGDSADGVRNVPNFSLFEFSTRNVDVLGVSATAGTCRSEPVKASDPLSRLEIVVPDMLTISCQGGTLTPGGSITATVTVKGKSPGVVSESPSFGVSGMQDSTPLQKWWEYPQFRVGVYQAPAAPPIPAFVDPTPLDQAELSAPAGGLLNVSKQGIAKLVAACHVATGCPQATLFYAGGKGKTKIVGQAKLRALGNGKTTTVTLKLTKKQLKALKAAKKKGVQITISGAELTISATLLARK